MFVVWLFVGIMTKMNSCVCVYVCVCVCGEFWSLGPIEASLLTYVELGFEKGKWHLERIEITWASLRLSRYHIHAHASLSSWLIICIPVSVKKLPLLACCYCLPLWLRNCRQSSSSHSSLLLPHSSLTKSLTLQVRFFFGFALFSETHFVFRWTMGVWHLHDLTLGSLWERNCQQNFLDCWTDVIMQSPFCLWNFVRCYKLCAACCSHIFPQQHLASAPGAFLNLGLSTCPVTLSSSLHLISTKDKMELTILAQ
jgi:hypothetical protein